MLRYKLLSLLIFILPASVVALDDYLAEAENELSTVFTPTRLEQHRKNVPAGVTIITAKKLKELGISTLPEAMRLVPGMRINQASGWDYRINFHGTNALIPRRMLVLIDGMSVYLYGFAQVDWNRLAVNIDDIEKIEVTRSPSVVSYGANAFQVVVNIITKHPHDVDTLVLSSENGTENFKKHYGRISGEVGKTAYSLSLSKHADDGFDSVSFNGDRDPVPDGIDDQRVDKFLFRSETNIDSKNKLEFRFGSVEADVEEEQVDSAQLAPPEKIQEDWHAHVTYGHIFNKRHHMKLNTYIRKSSYTERWDLCRPAVLFLSELRDLALVNSDLANAIVAGNIPTGSNTQENQLIQAALTGIQGLGAAAFEPLCGSTNNDIDEQTLAVELEDTYQPFSHTRINARIGYKENEVNSETFTNGEVGSHHWHMISNAEILLSKSLTLNAGLIYEDASNIDDSVFNSRLGLNYHFTDSGTVRIAYSSGSRLPNILETDRNWNYFMRNWDREFDGMNEGYLYLNTTGTENLKPEEVESFEIGLFGSANNYTYDVRVYKEELRNLISEKPTFFDFNLTNDSRIDLLGFEAELSYRLSKQFEVSGGYSYIDTEYTNFFEQTAHSDHAGFANLTYYSGIGTLSTGYYGHSKMAGEDYGRWDAVYLNSFKLTKDAKLELRLLASYLTNLDHAYQITENNKIIHSYDDPWRYRIKVSLSF